MSATSLSKYNNINNKFHHDKTDNNHHLQHVRLNLINQNILEYHINIDNNPPYFYPELMEEAFFLLKYIPFNNINNLQYILWKSDNQKYFSTGGDINHFQNCMNNSQYDILYRYAQLATDIIYHNQYCAGRNYETVAFVEGQALGGGAEFALSADCLVITKTAKMQLPEKHFGSFPGMGAYSFLTRHVGLNMAKQIIDSKFVMNSDFMIKTGIAEKIVENDIELYSYLSQRVYSSKSKRFCKIENIINKVGKDELDNIVNIWVEGFFNGKIHINNMNTISKIQDRATKLKNDRLTVAGL